MLSDRQRFQLEWNDLPLNILIQGIVFMLDGQEFSLEHIYLFNG